MDNNFNIPPNSPAFDMMNIMQHADNFIDKVKAADGLGLTEEQKIEFHEQMKQGGAEEALGELKDKMSQIRDAVRNFKKAQDNNKTV